MATDQRQPECIDLREHFGHKYRVVREESYRAQYGPCARVHDLWLWIIPCRYGHIYPFGRDQLAASVDGFPRVAERLRRLPVGQIHQDGDRGELTVVFTLEGFPAVAKIIRPRRRRHLSRDQRAKQAAHLARVRPTRAPIVCERASTASANATPAPATTKRP